MQAGEKAIKRYQCLIGTLRTRQLVDQHGHQFGKMGTRELALERAVFARKPAPHRVAHFERTAEAHRGELVERLGIVLLGWKRQRPARGFSGRRVLEQPRIMALHLAQMVEQHGGECVAVGKPKKTCEPLKFLALIR